MECFPSIVNLHSTASLSAVTPAHARRPRRAALNYDEPIEEYISQRLDRSLYREFERCQLSCDIPSSHPISAIWNSRACHTSKDHGEHRELKVRPRTGNEVSNNDKDIRFVMCIGVDARARRFRGWTYEETRIKGSWARSARMALKKIQLPNDDAMFKDIRIPSDTPQVRKLKEANETMSIDVLFYVRLRRSAQCVLLRGLHDRRLSFQNPQETNSSGAMDLDEPPAAFPSLQSQSQRSQSQSQSANAVGSSSMADAFDFNNLSKALPSL